MAGIDELPRWLRATLKVYPCERSDVPLLDAFDDGGPPACS